ncbi:ASCH domain-containing protein [Pseudonocardiaceae bacterium YIM PH 21723]|nr:ASCH domain-containing protein [Pseudonocardiaceae bacterium YIM PH 21723]
MSTDRHLRSVDEDTETAAAVGMPTAEALAGYLCWLANHRGRNGRLTSPETLRAYTSALPIAYTGIPDLATLDTKQGKTRLHTNVRDAWGKVPSTFNARRAAVASSLNYFEEQTWLDEGRAAALMTGLNREHQPKPTDSRVRDRGEIDQLIGNRRHDLEDRTLWSMLYSTAARAEEVLSLNIEHLDRPNRRAHTIRKGGKEDVLLYDVRTARMLGQLIGKRTSGPIFLSARIAKDGTVLEGDIDPVSRRRRMGYRNAERRIGEATGGWDLHDLRHSRLTHAGEDGATEADLMNLSGHEDRRTLQRYLKPSKEGTHRRLDAIDAQRGNRTPTANELAARMTKGAGRAADRRTAEHAGRALAGQQRALSIRRPWANLIMAGHKKIENRSWATTHRGELLVHAGQAWESAGATLAAELAITNPAITKDCPSGYLGTIRLTDVHPAAGCCTPWGQQEPGTFHWVLTDPRPFDRPIPGKGRLGLYWQSAELG